MPKLTVATPLPATAWDDLVRDYLLDRRAAGISSRTVYLYEDALRNVLIPFCAEEGVREPVQLTSKHLNLLTAELLDGRRSRSGKPLSKATVSLYMRAINTLLGYARDQGEKVEARARIPRERRKVLDVLTRQEIQAMEETASTERDRLVIRLLADTGIRIGELLAIREEDIQQAAGRHVLRVGGKTGQRLVPISPGLAKRLRSQAAWAERRGGDGRLFMSIRRSRTTGQHEPLTASAINQLVRHVAADAGISKRVYPHLFRHSMATEFLRRGGNPLLLQQILGHTTLAMIQATYSHLTVDDAHSELMRVWMAADH
jgi:integrase/recombinase XerD